MDSRGRHKRQRRDLDTANPAAGAANTQCCAPEAPQQQQHSTMHKQQQPEPEPQQQQQHHQLLQELPEALLTQIVLAGGTQRHLHGVLAAVCQDWRRCLLQNTSQLSVGLTSQAGAASLAVWLSHHAAALEQLHMATVGLFGRNCDNDTRLRLFQSLHRAAAGADDGPAGAGAASPGAHSDATNSSHSAGSDSPPQQQQGAPSPGSDTAGRSSTDNEVSPGSGRPASGSKSSAAGVVSDSPMPTPPVGGLFAGCAHLSTPSPNGDLIPTAAAGAAAAAAAGATGPATAGGVAGCSGVLVAAACDPPQQQQQELQEGQCGQPQLQEQQHDPTQGPQQQHDQTEQQQAPVQHQPQHLQLKQLSVNMRLTPGDCAAIASLPAPQLRSLWLQGSRTRRLGIDGVRCLAGMTALTSLKLQQFGIGDDATVLLASRLTGLQLLCACGNNIGAPGAAAIAQHCTQLEHLDLSINRLNAAALASIAGSLHSLRDLNLAGNGHLDAAGLQHLQSLSVLSHLTISSSSLGNADLSAVCSALPQLQVLDTSNNRITKAEPLSALVSLTSLTLSRNPLQLNCSKVLAGLPLQHLVLFDAAPARAVAALANSSKLTQHLTSLTLGADPSMHAEGSDEGLQLSKTRTCSNLFGSLAEAARLRVLSVPCTGLGDAQAKLLGKLGGSLQVLNVSYNCLTPAGLRVLRELPQLERLELRAMRPELSDAAIANISSCTRLTHLDLAHNDITSEGVKQLGCPALAQLQHLDLRNNAQVEKWSVLAAAAHLKQLTHINLLEISDVRARAWPRPAAGGPGARPAGSGPGAAAGTGGPGAGAASPVTAALKGRRAATAAAAGAGAGAGAYPAAGVPPAAAAAAGGAWPRAHADVWAALPNLEELLVETQSGSASRGGRFFSVVG